MNLEKEMENIFLVVAAVIALAVLIYFIGANYTGFAVYGGELFFDNNSDYASENINFSDSEMKLIPVLTAENTTTETDEEYYIDKSVYDKDDVSSLIKTYDNNYLEINGILEFELENNKKFKSNQILAVYLNGTESDLTLCKTPGLCKNNHTNIMQNIHFMNQGFYNFTINLENEKKKLYLEGNISIDYIYMIERNITTETNESLIYNNGYIETSDITISDLNDFNYFFSNYNEVDFYFLENGTWKEMNNGNISILTDTKLRAELNSGSSRLYNFSLLYNLKEINVTTPDNDTNITIPENETNVSIPVAPSGGGGGGGSSNRETRVLEQPVQEVTTPKEIRVLEQKEDLCKNGIKDVNEEGVDCGGSCPKCNSVLTILPYTNYLLFIMLLMVILTLLDKGRKAINNENSDS